MKSPWDQIQEETRLEAKLEANRETLLRQLEKKFGRVPEAARQRVGDAAHPEVERWLDLVLTATTLEEIFAPA
jgi:hypothetical protein